jgi:hypothetical protein
MLIPYQNLNQNWLVHVSILDNQRRNVLNFQGQHHIDKMGQIQFLLEMNHLASLLNVTPKCLWEVVMGTDFPLEKKSIFSGMLST